MRSWAVKVSTAGMSALLCAATIGVTSASAAAGPTTSVTASSAATAAAIARAEATGRAGTLVQYQPATDSWVQIGTVAAKPLSALIPLQPGVVAEPDGSFSSTIACLLASWSLAACENIAVTYSAVVSPSSPAGQIIKYAEGTGEDELKLNRLTITKWEELDEILEGASSKLEAIADVGFSGAAKGLEDSAEDIGAGVDFVFEIGVSVFG